MKLLSELKKIVAIDSHEPSGVTELADYYSSAYQSLGFRVKKDRFNNIAATRGKPTILFNAHLDTVAPAHNMKSPFSLRKSGDWVYGLGAADNKAALVALHSVMEKTVPDNVAVVLSANEDNRILHKGQRRRSIYFHLQKNKYAVKRGINCEPSGAGRTTNIYDAIGGKLIFDVVLNGKSVHSSSQKPHDNSIVKAANVIKKLDKLSRGNYTHHGKRFRMGVNIGLINGGTSRNTVAGRTTMACERRLLPGEDVPSIKRKLLRASGKMNLIDEIPPFLYGKSDAFKQNVSDAYKKVFRRQPAFLFTPVSTDSSIFWSMNKTKLLMIGPGELSTAHTAGERLNINQFNDVAKFYSELVKQQ